MSLLVFFLLYTYLARRMPAGYGDWLRVYVFIMYVCKQCLYLNFTVKNFESASAVACTVFFLSFLSV